MANQRMLVEGLVVRVAIIVGVVAGATAAAFIVHFDLAANLADCVGAMSFRFWMWSLALLAMPVILVVAATDRGRRPEHCEQVAGATALFMVLGTSHPLIAAFHDLGADTSLADRAPWISLALINLAFGALVIAAAILCARRLRADVQD